MKLLVFYFVFFLGCVSPSIDNHNAVVLTPQESESLVRLERIALDSFLNLPLEEFLNEIDKESLKTTYYADPPCFLKGVSLRYSDNLYVVVYFGMLKYQNNFKESCKWDNELLKKEKVIGIKIVKDKKEIKSAYLPEFSR